MEVGVRGSREFGPVWGLVPPHVAQRRKWLETTYQQLQKHSEGLNSSKGGGAEAGGKGGRVYVTPQAGPPQALHRGPSDDTSSVEWLRSTTDNLSPSNAPHSGRPKSSSVVIRHDVIKDTVSTSSSSSRQHPKGKIWNIDWLSNGSRIAAAAQNGIIIANPYTLSYESFIPGSFSRLCAHKTQPELICALTSDSKLQLHDLRLSPSSSLRSTATPSTVVSEHALPSVLSSSSSSQSFAAAALAWSPNGMYVAVSDGGHHLHLVDWANPKDSLASGVQTKSLSRVSAPSGTHKLKPHASLRVGSSADVNALDFDAFSEILLVATSRGSVEAHVMCPSSGKTSPQQQPSSGTATGTGSTDALCVNRAHLQECLSVAADPLGRYFLTAGSDQTVALFDMNTFTCVGTVYKLGGRVMDVDFSSSGLMAACCVEAELDGDVPVGHPSIALLAVDSLDIAWAGFAAGNPLSLRWSPRRQMLAYSFDISSNSYSPSSSAAINMSSSILPSPSSFAHYPYSPSAMPHVSHFLGHPSVSTRGILGSAPLDNPLQGGPPPSHLRTALAAPPPPSEYYMPHHSSLSYPGGGSFVSGSSPLAAQSLSSSFGASATDGSSKRQPGGIAFLSVGP